MWKTYPTFLLWSTPLWYLWRLNLQLCHSSVLRDTIHRFLDMTVVRIGDKQCKELIPFHHQIQIIHQVFACSIAYCIYMVASESQILYAVFSSFTQEIFDLALYTVGQYMSPHFARIHEGTNLPSYPSENQKKPTMTHLWQWNFINKVLVEEGPLALIKSFRHSVQTVY